ncbi:thioesterase family protein [Iamia sp. SCSIO 61187]|uniref:acyl-CoA thioesterase n=1 Tax=Iamia sp. SCSIO 61187 TaxID=2722752 RepID=UPI001C629866|nr:thioesterase family protein [Iamia sp. SCSIO 61187]QYG93212.1 thioesterase family protein [Iamia sp. SCSIO 61187]
MTEVVTPAETTHPRPGDQELIPLRPGTTAGASSFTLTPALARVDGALYGGTGVAASVLAMEAATQRDALWVVTQFIAPAHVGDVIELQTTELALGGRIAQLDVRAHVGDRLTFCALGSTAHPRPGGLTGQYVPMPAVSPPDDSAPMPFGPADEDWVGEGRRLEYRRAAPLGEAPPSGTLRLWARLRGIEELTPAGVAYLADMVPPALAHAVGRMGGGFSLDNSLRFGALPPTEWLLLDLQGELAAAGYGHGRFTAWTPDGALVATGSQTASMVHLFAPDEAGGRQGG